jgi:hypothetical protein
MPGLDEILKQGPNGAVPKPDAAIPAAANATDESELPELNAPYQAHARAANKPVYALHCLLGAKGCVSFEYVQLDSHSEFRAEQEGQIIRLRFAGSKLWEITISGLNLWRLYDLIHRHQVSWIRQSDRGFAAGADGEVLITGIQIKEIEREAG